MTTVSKTRSSNSRILALGLAPLLCLVVAAIVANLGLVGADRAHAATGTTIFNATVGSVASVSPCAGPVNITVVTGTLSSGTCLVTFGSSNNASQLMQVMDNDATAPFLSGAVFAQAGAGCTALAVDAAGFKVDTANLVTAVKSTTCAASAAATNTDYVSVPASLTNACTSTAMVTTNTCQIDVGVLDVAPVAAAGTYSGTMQFSAV